MATRPTFNPHDQDRLLRAMGEARRELCDAAIKMQSRSLTKAGAQTVIGNIDEMAFLLTGYRKFYQGNAAQHVLDHAGNAAAERSRVTPPRCCAEAGRS